MCEDWGGEKKDPSRRDKCKDLKTGMSCSQGVWSFLSKSRAGGKCGWRGRQEPDHTGPGRLQ